MTTRLKYLKRVVNPFEKFDQWYRHAGEETLWRKVLTRVYPPAVIHQPDAMVLATVSESGLPSARVVLLKSYDSKGFTFYTNYESRKGRELVARPYAALVFHWAFPERQIRIEGTVGKVTREESRAYWASRPRGSQLSGAASPQSRPVSGRAELEARVAELKRVHDGRDVECPEFWGGFRLVPERIEFWEARINRLHERVLYTRSTTDGWDAQVLAP